MTEQQKIWFDNLIKDRQDSAKTLEKHSMRGVKTSVVEKYSDQAHFIYELLQNADDAKATSAQFELQEKGLFFKHNGSVHFTVTNPETEETDNNNNRLGHINSITSVGSSSKNDQSTIGKFGVGFKAVFQYTETPHIYNRDFQFKIERFIVPLKLEQDIERQADETVFYFPFDKKEMPKDKAYSDILGKLKSLNYPVLFLNNLQSVKWTCNGETGEYSQRIIGNEEHRDDISYKKIELTQQTGLETSKEKLLLFTRKIEGQTHSYSIGFFIDKEGKLQAKKLSAFCFFPTKETTDLNFIIHAPFLLTDSREGIKRSENWNAELVNKLADLGADSLLILRDLKLIDDNIIQIIPYKQPAQFCSPFYDKIKKKLQNEEILPAINGTYAKIENAYWADTPNLTDLFSNEQLAQLVGKPEAKWVFTSIDRRRDSEITGYIDGGSEISWNIKEPNLIKSNLDFENKIAGMINADFTQKQSFDWLHTFYEYLSERKSYQEKFKTIPIFKDTNNNAVAAFEQNGKALHLILFLPTDDADLSDKFVHAELLNSEKSKEFIEYFGVKKPSLKDEIYNRILPSYKSNDGLDTRPHFRKFFYYWKENGRPEDFIDLIKDKSFVLYKTQKEDKTYRGKASEIYYPSDDLKQYFKTKPDTKFLDLDDYYKFITDENDQKTLKEFLLKLGIHIEVIINKKEKSWNNYIINVDRHSHHERGLIGFDKYITVDGLEEALKTNDIEKSKYIWNKIALQNVECIYGKVESSRYSNYNYSDIDEQYSDKFGQLLVGNLWIPNKDGNFNKPSELSLNDLPDGFIQDEKLALQLQMKGTEISEEQEIKKIISGRSSDEIAKALALLDQQNSPKPTHTSGGQSFAGEDHTSTEKTIKKIKERINKPKEQSQENLTEETQDEDNYTKPTVDYEKKKKQLEEKTATEIEKLARIEELTQTVEASEKYSFAWFKALIELEMLNSAESTMSKNKEISISFGKVELESGTTKTLILSQPNRYVPPHIEEFSDVPIKFENYSVIAESFSVKDYTLKAKLKSTDEIKGINFTGIKESKISVKSAGFLLEELQNCINSLKFQDDDNLKEKLPENLEFVFGPPGTGKTTYLAKDVLVPMMQKNEKCKILVLTPTNKAADVLSNRIMEQTNDFQNWLVRFGSSTDELIENSGILKDRTFNLLSLSKSVVVTTIARFTYDTFTKNEFGSDKLYDIKWDYIVFDEASMIHLPQIIFPLYKQKPQKFIIAGDPFQIGPIAQIQQWKDENIYTTVELDKSDTFVNPQTKPHTYNIVKLGTQFRSVVAIGELFSKFTYNGKLQHNRGNNQSLKLTFYGQELKPLNVIKFPVSKYESIYRSKKINNKSNYHIYSAILTFEFAKNITLQIAHGSKESPYRIGIISPYRIQADIVNKLISSHKFSDNIEIQAGTVHGYQGDECEVIISLFNTPPKISRSPDSFVNKQNILNVAISRARDYLFILMPDNKTEGIDDLYKIKQIEKIAQNDTENYFEQHSADIEKIIFNADKHIENITFSTTHQNVNVYGEPEKIYEVRCDDNAVDIQIKK